MLIAARTATPARKGDESHELVVGVCAMYSQGRCHMDSSIETVLAIMAKNERTDGGCRSLLVFYLRPAGVLELTRLSTGRPKHQQDGTTALGVNAVI